MRYPFGLCDTSFCAIPLFVRSLFLCDTSFCAISFFVCLLTAPALCLGGGKHPDYLDGEPIIYIIATYCTSSSVKYPLTHGCDCCRIFILLMSVGGTNQNALLILYCIILQEYHDTRGGKRGPRKRRGEKHKALFKECHGVSMEWCHFCLQINVHFYLET